MDVFNLLAGICSIVGLFVSCFTASKVYKMSNVETGDNSTIQNGEKNIYVDGGGTSYSAGDQSTITTYHFTEQVEKEPPILEKSTYNIIPQEYDKYKEGVDGKTCNLLLIGESNNFRFISDFSDIESHPEINRWIGFAIKSLPMYDWRSFVKDDYCLEFSYIGTDNVGSMWIELTPVYNFINDRLVDESAVLRPLSWHLILYVFRYFSRKWQKISDCECPDLIQNETPVRFLYGTQKNVRSDRAESSWHSN